MSDLIEHLRNWGNADTEEIVRLCDESADEIERLTSERDHALAGYKRLVLSIGKDPTAEIAKLTVQRNAYSNQITGELLPDIERLTAELRTSRYWRQQEVNDLIAERDALRGLLNAKN